MSFSKQNANILIAQTSFQKNIIKKSFNRTALLVRNFHPIPKINCVKKENYIIWIGALAPHKKPEYFLKLVEDLNSLDYLFILVGRAVETYPEIMHRVNSLKSKNFQYYEHLSLEDLNDLLSKTKILINTSQYEGFPNNFIQAWLRKVFVISLILDPDSLLLKKRLGIVAKDYNGLKNTVINFVKNEQLYDYYVSNAYEYAIKKFNINTQINQIEELILIGK